MINLAPCVASNPMDHSCQVSMTKKSEIAVIIRKVLSSDLNNTLNTKGTLDEGHLSELVACVHQ